MITIEIPERNKTLYLPENLAECDSSQYIDMAELIHRYNNKEILLNTFKIQAIYKLLNLQPTETKNQEHEEDKLSNIYMLTDAIDLFFEPVPDSDNVQIKLYHTNNHIPVLKPLWRTYYGPTDQFRNVKFGEYSDAINLYLEYEKTRDENLLYLILAIFYRKKKAFHFIKKLLSNYDGDVRKAYNESTVDQRAETLKILPIGFAYGFYLYLASFHKYITSAKIMLNGQEIDFSKLFEEPTEKVASSSLPGLGLKSIEYKIAESGVFGDSKQVRQTNMWEIYIRLYDITKAHEDERARMKEAEAKAKSKTQ